MIRGDSSADREARRRRWIAQCLRRAYDLDWVPDSVAARIIAVEWRADVEALVITLDTGTRLVDRSERIDVVGRVDDVAIAELVACVQRRGWAAVIVEGSDRFKAAATAALEAVGIEVQREVTKLTDIVPSQAPGWQ